MPLHLSSTRTSLTAHQCVIVNSRPPCINSVTLGLTVLIQALYTEEGTCKDVPSGSHSRDRLLPDGAVVSSQCLECCSHAAYLLGKVPELHQRQLKTAGLDAPIRGPPRKGLRRLASSSSRSSFSSSSLLSLSFGFGRVTEFWKYCL